MSSSNEDSVVEMLKRIKFLANLASHKPQPDNKMLAFDTLVQMDESDGTSPAEKISDTTEKQLEVEEGIQGIYDEVLSKGSDEFPVLNRKMDLLYVHIFMHKPLPGGMVVLEASHPWIFYWLMNAAVLLGGDKAIDEDIKKNASKAILSYLWKDGDRVAFSGGYGQLPHVAAQYAAIMSLAVIGDEDTWKKLDRKGIYRFLKSVKQSDGSFAMQEHGEVDCRSVYCALTVASVLDILDSDLSEGVTEWLVRCQTYEGGFSGCPGEEAHAGYAFCALAALCILHSPEEVSKLIDTDSLLRWTAFRQYNIEGGLSGRSNKLVDGCYSHWVGGMAAILECVSGDRNVLNRMALQNYILCCCQAKPFGLIDKPGCTPDFYHTNYVLCGLSNCQHYQIYDETIAKKEGCAFGYRPVKIEDTSVIDNLPVNIVEPIDPIFGVPAGKALKMRNFYRKCTI